MSKILGYVNNKGFYESDGTPFELLQDENNILKVNDEIISKRKSIWQGSFGGDFSEPTELDITNLDVNVGDILEFKINYADSEIKYYKVQATAQINLELFKMSLNYLNRFVLMLDLENRTPTYVTLPGMSSKTWEKGGMKLSGAAYQFGNSSSTTIQTSYPKLVEIYKIIE